MIIGAGLRLHFQRSSEFDEMLALDLAAAKIGNVVLFDLGEHLGLGPANLALGLADVAIDHIAEPYVLAAVDDSFGKFGLSSCQPCPGDLFAVEGLTLAVDDLSLTFE